MNRVSFWLVGLCLATLVFSLASPSEAQNLSRLESRLNRLESKNDRLRGRIERLEAALRRADFGPSGGVSPAPRSPSLSGKVASEDPMFDRLAVLVVELKERVRALEAEVFPEPASQSQAAATH